MVINDFLNKITYIDCQKGINELPDESISCIITSPPYWTLRSYDTVSSYGGKKDCNHSFVNVRNIIKNNGKRIDYYTRQCSYCGMYEGELGGEPNYYDYIDHLSSIFNSLKRILKNDGSLWINISDTYSKGNSIELGGSDISKSSLIGIPERLMINLIDSGWILRNKIIWKKPNAMPNAVKNRFTNDYEMFYFFTKTKNYYFKQQFEPYLEPLNRRGGNVTTGNDSKYDEIIGQNRNRKRKIRPNENGRNMRSIWEINTESSQNKHCAVFPKKLVEIPILSCTKENDIVLDPFAGSGTVNEVCQKYKRNFIGFELSNKI